MESFPAPQLVASWLLLNLVVVGLYDVAATWWFGEGASVTHVLRAWSASYPALPFLVGLLMGHFFAW